MTRVRLAVLREQLRIKRAQQEAVDIAAASFSTAPDLIQSAAIVSLAMQRGDIAPQEGAELVLFAKRYAETTLAERIVLCQSLLELSGRRVSIRPPIFQEVNV